MKIKKKKLFHMIHELKKAQNKHPDIDTVAKKVSLEFNTPNNEALQDILKIQLKAYKRLMNSSKKSFDEKLQSVDQEITIDSEEESPMDTSTSTECRKSFVNAKDGTKRKRTQQIIDLMKNLVDGEDDLTMTQLMGYLLHRTHYHIDRNIADLGNHLYNDTYQHNFYNIDQAIAIMHTLVLTKEQLRLFKNILKSRNISFPNTNDLNEARKKLRPIVNSTPDNKGVFVNYKELVKQTVTSQIEELGLDLSPRDKLSFLLKDGCDGAGSQTVNKTQAHERMCPQYVCILNCSFAA